MATCRGCGTENPSGATICRQCGRALQGTGTDGPRTTGRKPGLVDFVRYHTGIFDKDGNFSLEGAIAFIGRSIKRRTKAFVRGFFIGAAVHFFIVGWWNGYTKIHFPFSLIIPVFGSFWSIITYPPAVIVWMSIGMWLSYRRSLKRPAGGPGTPASLIVLLPWTGVLWALIVGEWPAFADDGGFQEQGGLVGPGTGPLLVQSALAGIAFGVGWAAGEEASDFLRAYVPAQSAGDERKLAEPERMAAEPVQQVDSLRAERLARERIVDALHQHVDTSRAERLEVEDDSVRQRERERIDQLLETIRGRQRGMVEEERDEFGLPIGLDFVLEARERNLDALHHKLEPYLPSIRFRLERVFPDAAPEDDVLGRLVYLRIPGLGFSDQSASPWDLAHFIRDALGLARVEPDLETDFYNARELLGLECFESDAQVPPDRAWALRQIRVPEAWQLTPPPGGKSLGEGILVAQPDTGVSEHEELLHGAVALERGANFLEVGRPPIDPLSVGGNPGHGTATSSVVASRGTITAPDSGGTGGPGLITGAAPAAVVVPIRAIKSVARISQTGVARAVDYATRQGFPIISMSLGGLPSMALQAALQRAVANNVIVLAAAGNCVELVCYPASDDNCIAVAATNINEQLWKGSCCGSPVDVSAPGEFVWRAERNAPSDPTTKVSGGQGTSFAVALTAGVAALWLAFHGRDRLIASLRPGETLQARFRWLLKETARRPVEWNEYVGGAGIVDAAALLKADPMPPSAGAPMTTSKVPGIEAELEAELRAEAGFARPAAATRLTAALLDKHGTEIEWLLLSNRQRLLTADVPEAREKLTHANLPASVRLEDSAARSDLSALKVLLAMSAT